MQLIKRSTHRNSKVMLFPDHGLLSGNTNIKSLQLHSELLVREVSNASKTIHTRDIALGCKSELSSKDVTHFDSKT